MNYLKTKFLLIFILIFATCACAGEKTSEADEVASIDEEITDFSRNTETNGGDAVPEGAGEPALSEKEIFINDIMEDMDTAEKVGQMFICSFEVSSDGGALLKMDDATRETVEKYALGGVIYFSANIDTTEQTKKLSADFQELCKIPMFVATDEEGGIVTRITKSGKIDAIEIPAAKTVGNTGNSKNAYITADIIAKEVSALDINTSFVPCADLNSDNQGVIGTRAYSGDPQTAGEFVKENVKAFIDNKVVGAAKHFPGHGVAPGDTHDEGILSEKSLDEILKSDIIPFQMAADAGVPMIMMSHITVPEWGVPASLSKDATEYIRNTMNYDGVIITDSFRMGAITNYYPADAASLSSIKAGVDIVLIPENIDEAINSVTLAVENGEIEMEQINKSVERILSLKYDYGMFEREAMSMEEAAEILDSSKYAETVNEIFREGN